MRCLRICCCGCMKKDRVKYRRGQSLVEGLVLLLVLISFFIAIPWLGRLLDIGLQQTSASRYMAFQWTRRMVAPDDLEVKQKFFLAKEHNWRDRQQHKIVNANNITIRSDRQLLLSDEMQPGQRETYAPILRQQWGIADKGVVIAQLQVTPQYWHHNNVASALGIDAGFLERLPLTLYRHTAILMDAGHSDTDENSHRRAGTSALAWKDVTERSYALGQHIQRYAEPVEGFDRDAPVFDWLVPWAGKLPQHHLKKNDNSVR